MRIVVFSDSHGSVSNLIDVAERETPDLVLHLGDHWRDAQRFHMACPQIPVLQVPGNCDSQPGAELELLIEEGGARIFLCHGHTRRVKQGYGAVIAEGMRLGADVVLFGHTHQPYLEQQGKLWIMNPGSMSRYGKQSYGTIRISDGKITCQLQEWD